MLGQCIWKIFSEFLVFDILEHEFNSLNDPLSIVTLDLTVIELLHIVMFLASES